MIYYKHIKYLLLTAVVFFCVACEAPPAYVYIEGEFDRGSVNFLKGVTTRDLVKICYHKNSTTPQQVMALALNECKKLSKAGHICGTKFTSMSSSYSYFSNL